MYNNWSLDILYRGIDDENLAKDMARFENLIALFGKAVAELDKNDAAKTLRRVI